MVKVSGKHSTKLIILCDRRGTFQKQNFLWSNFELVKPVSFTCVNHRWVVTSHRHHPFILCHCHLQIDRVWMHIVGPVLNCCFSFQVCIKMPAKNS